MKAGKTVRTFTAKDGRKVTLRTIRWEDLDDLLELINSLVTERANIIRDTPVSREEEIEWLSKALALQEKGEVIYVVAVVDGKVVANSEIRRRLSGYDKHTAIIGVAIKEGFRDLGLGTEIMKTLIQLGREMKLKVLMLTAFANNTRAIHVYQKLGFKETGRIPQKFFKDGNYIDEVLMTCMLE